MAHPDLVKKYNYIPDVDPHKWYVEAAEAVHEGHRAIELNTSGWGYACNEQFPSLDLLREFHHAEVPCCLGTDAHETSRIDYRLESGIRVMYEAGYREITVPLKSGEVISIPIE